MEIKATLETLCPNLQIRYNAIKVLIFLIILRSLFLLFRDRPWATTFYSRHAKDDAPWLRTQMEIEEDITSKNSFARQTVSNTALGRELPDCQSIRKIFEQYEYSKEHECAIQCVQFFANGTFSFGALFPEAIVDNLHYCFAFYRGCLGNFLLEVTANQTQLVGTAIAKAEDKVDLPMALVKHLLDIDVPVLAHAIDKQFQETVILIPDFHFIQHSGFSELTHKLRKIGKPLRDRSEVVYWRGSSTGLICDTESTINLKNTSTLRDPCAGCSGLQRVAAAQIAENISFLDIAISNAVQYCQESDLQIMFPSFNQTTGQQNNELDWVLARGILDIDGNSNAWGARWRLESGSVVFKVESNITNAYLSRLEPYVHYIPIFANLSNLVSQAQLVVGNATLPFLEYIVQNANQLMAEFTYEKEIARVRSELVELWGGTRKDKRVLRGL